MLTQNWRLALVTLALGPIVILVALGFRRLARRAMQQSQRAQAEVNATIQETISGIAVAKNFRQEAAIYEDFRSTNELAYRVQLLRVAVFNSIYPLLNTVCGIGVAVVVYFGGLMALSNTHLGRRLVSVRAKSGRSFFYPITSIASFWSQFQQGLSASERVFALIDAEPQVRADWRSEPVGRLRGEITFEHVTVQLQHLDRTRRRAAARFLARPSRPAKRWRWSGIPARANRAWCKLIMRFYEFQGGQLLIDGRDIRTLDLARVSPPAWAGAAGAVSVRGHSGRQYSLRPARRQR